MEVETLERLIYRNQYILAPSGIDCPFLHSSFQLTGSFNLYVHPDLPVSQYINEKIRLVLLGDLFDYESSQISNDDILKRVADTDFSLVLNRLSRYTGRYILIFIKDGQLLLSHDATATKKIYYCQTGEGVWCASQPHLLARITGIHGTTDSSKLKYYRSESFRRLGNASIGNTTYYDEIHQVLPNHYFDVSKCAAFRYWPNKRREFLSLEECADRCTKMIHGYVNSIAGRYRVMLPVTAGGDTRTLLSATVDMKDEVYYYINKEKRMMETDNDLVIPTRLFEKIGVDFHVVDPYEMEVDQDFKRIYYQNNPFASDMYLPIIYNYFLNFSNRVNLPGNIATGAAWYYPTARKHVSTSLLLTINRVGQYMHAWNTYHSWLNQCIETCNDTGYHPTELFYWEERLGNWGTQTQLDKEIAQVDINPYNSRLLDQTILSVKPYHSITLGNYPLYSLVIKNLWPEVLQLPINPGLNNRIISMLDDIGLLGIFYKLWYN